MAAMCAFPGARPVVNLLFVASLLSSVQPVTAEVYPLIIKGKVTMPDGSPPPFTVGIERVCSDAQGSAPGPITDKKGEYLWRMDVDPMRTRSCVIHATHAGYTSSSIDISALNGYNNTTTTLDTIVLSGRTADPYAIISSDSGLPSRASSPWKAAMKALDTSNFAEAATQMQAAVQAAPKFAIGWHALGVVQEKLQKTAEARDAYEHAIEADPKMLQAYVALTRLCLKTKDWQGAAKTADALIKADSKKTYTEIYLHQAVARYGLKDLDGAAASAQEAVQRKVPRAEYVLGRVLEAKGDAAGAREHISKYLELDKNTPDAELIRSQLQNVGKPDAARPEAELLELLF
jgi:Flp pilus assembly protein TadD